MRAFEKLEQLPICPPGKCRVNKVGQELAAEQGQAAACSIPIYRAAARRTRCANFAGVALVLRTGLN
jgi:hypothetical protein